MENLNVVPNGRAGQTLARPVLITDGDKGGVGKSFLARIVVSLIESQGFKWKGIDLDSRNGHLKRYHQESDVVRLEWTDSASWNTAYDYLIDTDDDAFVVIDLPAQTGTVASDELPRLVATARSQGRPVYRLWVLGSGFDSVNLLNETFELVSPSSTIVVLNLREARREQFKLWNNSKLRKTFLAAGGVEILLPKLPDGASAAIEEDSLPFHRAIDLVPQPYFKFDIEGFLARVRVEFSALLEILS